MVFRLFIKFFILFFVSFSVAQARVDQTIIDEAMKMTTPDYKDVAQPVQAINFLAHELSLEEDPARAKQMAETLLGMLGSGEGVGGMADREATPEEAKLMIKAFGKAVGFLTDGRNFESGTPAIFRDNGLAFKELLGGDSAQEHQQALWRGVDQFAGAPEETNAGRALWLGKKQEEEKQQVSAWLNGDNYDDLFPDDTTPMTRLKRLKDILKETVIDKTAKTVAGLLETTLVDYLKKNNVDELATEVIVVLETYRAFETSGDFEKKTPSMFSWQSKDIIAVKMAEVMAIASAVQDMRYHDGYTVEDLIRLFKYKKNSRELTNTGVRQMATDWLSSGRIKKIITQDLVNEIHGTRLAIRNVQKLKLDAFAKRQKLMYYAVPEYDMRSGAVRPVKQFMRYVGSEGDGACGFYSLDQESREDVVNLILDNLEEPEILAQIDQVASISASVIRCMNILTRFNGKKLSEIVVILQEERPGTKRDILERVLKEDANTLNALYKIFAKKRGIPYDPNDDAQRNNVKAALLAAYTPLKADIDGWQAQLEAKKVKAWRDIGFTPDKRPEDASGEIYQDIADHFDSQKKQRNHEFVSLVYGLDDLKEIVKSEIEAKFIDGYLEFDPTPQWTNPPHTFPLVIAHLLGRNIDVWQSFKEFEETRKEPEAHHIAHYMASSEDNKFVLLTHLGVSPTYKTSRLFNLGRVHFEKWITASDYGRLARAKRHQAAHPGGCTRDTR